MQTILCLLTLVAANTAFAQSAVGSGSPRASEGTYIQDSAIASDASGVAKSANYENRSGYVGQLYDVTALALIAAPTSVGERSTTQLGASATLDDGTLIVPAPSEVTWSVVSGPVTAIAVAGSATADNVSQDTSATVRGTYAGVSATLAVTVLNLTNDDLGSYAGDGLPDDWQVANFGLGSASAGPTADPDGDGQNNFLEYLAGTNPNLGTSVFRVRIEAVSGQPSQKKIIFGPVAAGRTYRVLNSIDLAAASWVDISGALSGASGELTFTDTVATGARKFYRVQISNP